MDIEWVWLWFRCLKLNQPYKRYCKLRKTKTRKERTTLEKQNPQIAEVYKDFGDIHAFKVLGAKNRKHWEAWLNEHRHLFMTNTGLKSRLINEPVKELDGNYLYLKIAVQRRKLDAVNAATKIIRDNYPASVAKYQLSHKVPSEKALGTLRRQLNVWHKLNPIKGKAFTNETLVNQIISDKIGRPAEWAWSPRKPGGQADWKWSKEYVDLKGNTYSLVRQVQRYNSEAKNIIANTIHGVFPVKTAIK